MNNRKNSLTEQYVGATISIVDMWGEPQYAGRKGTVEYVDDMCQLHGTWGGLAIDVDKDIFLVIK